MDGLALHTPTPSFIHPHLGLDLHVGDSVRGLHVEDDPGQGLHEDMHMKLSFLYTILKTVQELPKRVEYKPFQIDSTSNQVLWVQIRY